MTPLERIAAIIDAAQPMERPLVAAPARASAPKDKTGGGRKAAVPHGASSSNEDGKSVDPHADAGEGSASFASPSAVPPGPLQGQESTSATLAAEDDETEQDKIAACSDFDTSDTDNGKRLIRYFGRDLLVMAQQGRVGGLYMTWRGTHWDLDGGEAGAHLLAQQVGDLIKLEADYLAQTPQEEKAIGRSKEAQAEFNAIDPADEREEAKTRKSELQLTMLAGKAARSALAQRKKDRRKHGLGSKNKARLDNMLNCAAPRLRRPPDAFNVDPLLIATSTHTVRLIRELDQSPDVDQERWRARAEALAQHRREDMLTSVIPVAYDPDAKGPRWTKFLDRVLPQRDKRRMVQSFTGSGITGLPVQRLMFHTGGGANGKSVFLELVTRLLGDSFAVGLPVESITGIAMGTGSQASPDIARLFGKRLLRVHELPAGALLRAEVIKKLTGGERLVARELNKGFFEFTPIAKVHMSGNDFPQFDGSDGGMKRRLVVAHWTETIPEAEQRDFQELVSELLAEGSAILNWLIEGACDFLANGLVVDEGDRAVTQSYFNEMNPVGQFAAACFKPEQDHNEKARDVYNAYVAWSLANAKKPMSEARFGRTLKKTHPRDDTGRVHMYVNVRLDNVPEAPPDKKPPPEPPPQTDEEIAF